MSFSVDVSQCLGLGSLHSLSRLGTLGSEPAFLSVFAPGNPASWVFMTSHQTPLQPSLCLTCYPISWVLPLGCLHCVPRVHAEPQQQPFACVWLPQTFLEYSSWPQPMSHVHPVSLCRLGWLLTWSCPYLSLQYSRITCVHSHSWLCKLFSMQQLDWL